MRTTLTLDDRVLSAARSLASARQISLGAAVSELALRGLAVVPDDSSPARLGVVDVAYSPFPVMVDDGADVITDELVAAHRD